MTLIPGMMLCFAVLRPALRLTALRICETTDETALYEKIHYTPPDPNDGYGPRCYTYASKLVPYARSWSPKDWNAEYCLSEKVAGNCGFNINLGILWIIVICNIVKVIVMSTVAFSPTIMAPLMTVGDAIASFLTNPDPTTTDMCLSSRVDVISRISKPTSLTEQHQAVTWKPPVAQTWNPQPHRWAHAASTARWWFVGLL